MVGSYKSKNYNKIEMKYNMNSCYTIVFKDNKLWGCFTGVQKKVFFYHIGCVQYKFCQLNYVLCMD